MKTTRREEELCFGRRSTNSEEKKGDCVCLVEPRQLPFLTAENFRGTKELYLLYLNCPYQLLSSNSPIALLQQSAKPIRVGFPALNVMQRSHTGFITDTSYSTQRKKNSYYILSTFDFCFQVLKTSLHFFFPDIYSDISYMLSSCRKSYFNLHGGIFICCHSNFSNYQSS